MKVADNRTEIDNLLLLAPSDLKMYVQTNILNFLKSRLLTIIVATDYGYPMKA